MRDDKLDKTGRRGNRRHFLRQASGVFSGFLLVPRFVFPEGSIFHGLKSSREGSERLGEVNKANGALRIISNGKSDYRILLTPEASENERFAAGELKKYIKSCSNVELEILEEEAAYEDSSKLIVLGSGSISRQLGVSPGKEDLGAQGFQIKTSGTNLVIAGTKDGGTLYGVYRFLEGFLGIRWLAPDQTILPEVADLNVPCLDRVIKPAFLSRNISYRWAGAGNDFFSKIRLNTRGRRNANNKYGFIGDYDRKAHSYHKYISPDDYFEDHPEYFSEIGGQRIKEETQLCLTNREVFYIVCEKILAKMRNTPGQRQYNFSQMDYYHGCDCEKCRAINEKYGTAGGTQFWFVNKLAERTSREFPDKLISTLAYTYTEKPPVGMKMHPNVVIWLCHMFPCCNSHPITECTHNSQHKKYAMQWSSICTHIYIWYYIVDFAHYYNPFPNFRAIALDFRFYKEMGVEGIYAQGMGQGGGGGEFSLLRGYYCSRLLLDPFQDSEEVLKDFLQGYYGKAWEPLSRYIRLLQDYVDHQGIHIHLYDNPGYLDDQIISESAGLFAIAQANVADNAVLLRRVETARLSLDYALLFPRNGYRVEQGKLVFSGEPGSPKDAARFINGMKKNGFSLIREHGGDPVQLLAMAGMFHQGIPVVSLSNDSISADIVPQLGGRVLRLIHKKTNRCVTAYNNVRNIYFPFSGGLECRVGESSFPDGWSEPAEIVSQTKDSVTTRAKLRNGLVLEREMIMEGKDGSLLVSGKLINPGKEPREERLRSHMELKLDHADEVPISFTGKDGRKRIQGIKAIVQGEREGIHYYENEIPDGSWTYHNKGLKLIQRFDPSRIESVWFYAYPEESGILHVELWQPGRIIPAGGQITIEEKIEIHFDN